MLCARGNAGVKQLYDPDRLKYPLLRKGALEDMRATNSILHFTRAHEGETMFCAFNFGDTPAELAHDFMQITGDLFYRAVWARIGDISEAADLRDLAEDVLCPARDWSA